MDPTALHRLSRARPGAAFARTALLLAACAAAAGAPLPAAEAPTFKLSLERGGVVRVGFDDLPWGEEPVAERPSDAIEVSNLGRPVPIWVEDGGDGRFGPGDSIEFVAEHLAGESSYYNPHTRFNVYLLGFDRPGAPRMSSGGAPADAPGAPRHAAPQALRHLERDLIMLRLPPRPDGKDELWYWAKLTHTQKEPFRWTLEMPDLDEAAGPVTLRLGLRGWSRPRTKADPETPDHALEVTLDGVRVAAAGWDGTGPHVLEVPPLPAGLLKRGSHELALKVPKRPADGPALIDVVMLNWIEVEYPLAPDLGSGQVAFEVRGAAGGEVELAGTDERPRIYGRGGARVAAIPGAGERTWRVRLPADESSFVAAAPSALRAPARIERRRTAGLASPERRADYLIITDPRFREAVEPLAELHRSRGLEVVVAGIDEVVDEFGHGVLQPEALRDFVAHAYHRWRPPAPRFVLLVGDASWDGRNELAVDANYADWPYRPGEVDNFPKNTSTPYSEEGDRNRRGLIPTWSAPTSFGHAASDNAFVAVDGDDALPDLAIGRLPVVTVEEVEQIVAKTARYVTSPEVGPWRRRALFITNENLGFQGLSDRLAGELASAGLAAERVYPDAAEPNNEHHTQKLVESFSRGQLFVHFLGHGGRYIWRTGPPDLKKNHDLFTLDHVDQIEPSSRLAVVLSLTCYSAPFDHPNADSIGEKLLRVADRGAVGVLAASWRNSPTSAWGRILLEELTLPGATVGEAVTAAKRRIGSRIFVDTYNLLGDPAVPVALPAASVSLQADAIGPDGVRVRGVVGLSDFAGELLVELVDEAGRTLASTRLRPGAAEFSLELPASPAEIARAEGLRAYAWDAERGVDAVGGVTLRRMEPDAAVAEAPAGAAGGGE